jgi:hypothetical protein
LEKISGRGPQGAWRQNELIGGKLPVVSNFDFDFEEFRDNIRGLNLVVVKLTPVEVTKLPL